MYHLFESLVETKKDTTRLGGETPTAIVLSIIG
jgi:hypothetical protein